MFTVEETLKGSDIDTALTTGPYLIYSEVFEGARRPLAFLTVVKEDFSLIGQAGNTIKFMSATQLAGHTSSESTILSSGMAADDKTVTSVSVQVTDPIWSAVEMTDILAEDYPNVEWLRMHLRNMGSAVLEYLDSAVYDVFVAASGTVTNSCTSLAYGTVVDSLAKMENGNWLADERNPPYLIVSPEAAAGLVKDTAFVDARRYTAYEVSKMVEGEIGMYGGCRVLKTSLLDGKAYCFIIFPNDGANGPVALLAWKRRLTVKNEYFAQKAYTYYVTSIRAKGVVVQAKGVCKITQTTTP
jgi:N4-gp56 family major capsid protein